MRSLRRLIGRLDSYYYRRSLSSLSSQCIHSFGVAETPKSIHCKVPEDVKGGYHPYMLTLTKAYTKTGKELEEEEELTSIKKGDIVDLSDLLFTESRDYLIKCNDGRQVKAEELAGKVVVIYFDAILDMDTDFLAALMHVYNDLQPISDFEVVFVNDDDVDIDDSFSDETSVFPASQGGVQKHFEDIISSMPWSAIPLSDATSRKHLKRRFGLPKILYIGTPIIIDSTGMILQSHAHVLFRRYGALGYPFSDERIDFLNSEDEAAARQPSLKNLLASPERDYLISNEGHKVPIRTLEDKVVGLYFYNNEGFLTPTEKTTLELKNAYQELAKNKKFEIVLIYLYDTPSIEIEESFWNSFKTMPWLALPFGDPNYKKLQRIFINTWDSDGRDLALTFIGPHVEFIEPFGLFILWKYKIPAYPFSREKVANLLAEGAKTLKLEMLWEPDSMFGGKYGTEVSFSQLAGKRVIIFFDRGELRKRDAMFLESMKDRYIQMKGTNDEFEVIHITKLSSKSEDVANMPWCVQPCGYHVLNLFDLWRGRAALIAFDGDGRVVRKTVCPTFEDTNYPFYQGSLEEEALSQLVYVYCLDRYDGYPGSIYSYKKKG